MLALMRAGYTVLTAPFTDCARYDCVLDDGGRFLRVQIKTGRRSRDARSILFATASHNRHRRTTRAYAGEVEFFAVFCPPNGRTYLVPAADVGTKVAVLRLELARNGQQSGIWMAADYEVAHATRASLTASRVPPEPPEHAAPPRVPGRLKGRVDV